MLSIRDFSKKQIKDLIATAAQFENKIVTDPKYVLPPFICGLLFFEPSTRTMCSFQSAVARLGGTSIVLPGAKDSSMAKGETEMDTVRTMSQYCDVLVIRHPQKGLIRLFSESLEIPVINAGDGEGEHPTQALLDLYTVYKHCGRLDDVTVWAPDSERSRTVNSLRHILGLFDRNEIYDTHVLPGNLDIIYMSRYQKERFLEDAHTQRIVLDEMVYNTLPKEVGIMHPLPRGPELPAAIDNRTDCAKILYFDQMKNGIYARMAILHNLLKNNVNK